MVVTVPRGAVAGTWSLSSALLTDSVGNGRGSTPAASFTQTGGGDSAVPVVHSVEAVDPTRVDTCNGPLTAGSA